MYKVFTDKQKTFKCNIDISGASLKDCYARLIMETKEGNFFFKGNVDSSGNCFVDIPKIKLIEEGIEGKMKLEVIVENTIFNPWESDFLVATSKKVNVTIDEGDEDDKPKINESKTDNSMKVLVKIDEGDEDEIEEVKTEVEKSEKIIEKNTIDKNKVIEKEDSKKELNKIEENVLSDDKNIDKLNDDIFNFDDFLQNKK